MQDEHEYIVRCEPQEEVKQVDTIQTSVYLLPEQENDEVHRTQQGFYRKLLDTADKVPPLALQAFDKSAHIG